MKSLSGLFIVIFIFFGCDKDRNTHTDCNIQQAYADNAKKVTITNGIWELFLLWKGIACRWCHQQIQPVKIALLNEQ
jgi:hypothetical protein